MWNSLPYDIKFDLIAIFIALSLAAMIAAYLIAKATKRSHRKIKVLQEEGEYSIEPDENGMASFVLILDGQAKKITLKRGE